MTAAKERYEAWLQDPAIDAATKDELRGLAGQDAEIEDRFYKDLTFGTGGLRGVIGAGTNRMNRYTVGRATQGLAQALLAGMGGSGAKGAVIAYDSRNQSPEFAEEAARVLAANGVKAYVFESLRPTPELSFAVRHLGASAGIVVTASHNPPEYNGYKVYGPDGGQLVPDMAEQVMKEIDAVPTYAAIRTMPRAEAESRGLLEWVGADVDDAYAKAVCAAVPGLEGLRDAAGQLKVVYTPLHGAGNRSVREVLRRAGFTQVQVVPEQERPDPHFSTVASPNPEEAQAFTLALALARKSEADLVIGTDPDSDRMGAAVKHGGEYRILTGNQAGAIMLYYLLTVMRENGALPHNGTLVKTIVTSELGAAVAADFGLDTVNTLTGFKYIGERMTKYERTGERSFVFGYEESYGYLAGMYCRDKDAVLASLLISEAAAFYKRQGRTLIDVLEELFDAYGAYLERLESRTMKGIDGLAAIGRIMDRWRTAPPRAVGGVPVARVLDYAPGLDGLPPENVLKFLLEDGSWFCLRPSGTEPKIKIYLAVRGSGVSDAETKLQSLAQHVLANVE